MPRYPERDLSDQYISLSYQDVLQQYVNTGSYLYVLDGYGNVVFGIGTSSLGQPVITSDMTSSMTVLSASYALTASYLDNPDGGYAGMFMDNANYLVVITSSMEWTKIANSWTSSYVSPIHRFERNHEIRVGETGFYFVFWQMAIETAFQAAEIEGAIAINHVIQPEATSHRSFAAGGTLGSFSAGNIFYITSGSTVQSYIRNNLNTTDVTVSHAQLSLIRSFAYDAIVTQPNVSASYAGTASFSFVSNTSLTSTSSIYADTASIAIYSEYAGTASIAAEALTASYVAGIGSGLETGSTYPITASYAVSASWAPGGGGTVITSGSYWNITSSNTNSASVAISSSHALTASYVAGVGSGLATGSTYPITSSHAISASWAPGGGGTGLETGSIYPITSSHALTASYVANLPSGSTESASYALTASYAMNQGISIPKYDFSYVEYNGPYNQFSKCTYRFGGASGSIVCIVDAYYDGSLFIGVSKSLG